MTDYDPFDENIVPYDSSENAELYPNAMLRSCMWDMVGPDMLRNPEKYGESPASPDVAFLEYQDMLSRKRSLVPFGPNISMGCYVAATAATRAVIASEPRAAELTEEEKSNLLTENIRVSIAVTSSVLSHMLKKGLLHYGAHV